MRRYYFVKKGAPIWIHVPGTPFTLPGERPQYSRLPGMDEWAPNEVVERVGKGLNQNISVDELAEREANQELDKNLTRGGLGGLVAGTLGARLFGGEAVGAPFKEIGSKGLSRATLGGFKNLPRSAKLAPLIGAGAGILGGLGAWASGREGRKEEAQEVSKGLLSEKILQQHSLGRAREYANPVLKGLPAETASMPAPVAAVPGNAGV